MVGDGVNDAPALTQANVGFAIGDGTDVAMESADVVLMKSDPYDVLGAIELSSATLRKMHRTCGGNVGYNVIAFPLAAGVVYPFVLSPEVAALSMSGSTLVVAINALMLKRIKMAGIRQPGKTTVSMATGLADQHGTAKSSAPTAVPVSISSSFEPDWFLYTKACHVHQDSRSSRWQPDLRSGRGGGGQTGQVDRCAGRLIHVIDQYIYATGMDGFSMTADPFVVLRESGEKILKASKARVEAAGVPVETTLLESLSGRVCDLVVAEARNWAADLIVTGTHGRRGVGRMFMGSDAEQIVRLAASPVLLVRATETTELEHG